MRDDEGYRLLADGAMMSAASAVRAWLGCIELWSQRVPPLVRLAAELAGDAHPSEDLDRAPAKGRLRDELIAVGRDSTDVVLRELQRGIADLDMFTRPEEAVVREPVRRCRAKP